MFAGPVSNDAIRPGQHLTGLPLAAEGREASQALERRTNRDGIQRLRQLHG